MSLEVIQMTFETYLILSAITVVGFLVNLALKSKFAMTGVYIVLALLAAVTSAIVGGWEGLGFMIFAMMFAMSAVTTLILSVFIPS
jgi:hypothetical protein